MRGLLAAILLLYAVPVRADTLVFAAASLTDALTAVADDYAKTGAARPALSFAASSALARQIENGAPAAIFISADEEWMTYLADRKLIDASSRVTLLGNRLVMVSSAPMTLDGLKTLGAGKLALADPDSVPAGKYAKAALDALGLWTTVQPNVVRAENVRAALAFVERGEAKAGIVYATDAAAAKKATQAVTFPANSHPPITYPAALVGSAPNTEAVMFYAYIWSDAAKAVYRRFGFSAN